MPFIGGTDLCFYGLFIISANQGGGVPPERAGLPAVRQAGFRSNVGSRRLLCEPTLGWSANSHSRRRRRRECEGLQVRAVKWPESS
jgi:hypothetical protein